MQFLRHDYDDIDHAEAIGQNYDGLIRWVLLLVGIAGLLAAAYWYGYVLYPRYQVLERTDGEIMPLREEIPLDVMPALPDSLAAEYDALNDAQRDQLTTYSENAGSDTVTIPIDVAIDVLLEQGLPTE